MNRMIYKTLGPMLVISLILTVNILGMRALAIEDEDPVKSEKTGGPPDGVWVGYEVSTEKYVADTRLEHFGWIGGEFTRVVNVYEYRKCCRLTGRNWVGCSVGIKCSD